VPPQKCYFFAPVIAVSSGTSYFGTSVIPVYELDEFMAILDNDK
jgi:hypothetical protein